jgi:hypothetical protein
MIYYILMKDIYWYLLYFISSNDIFNLLHAYIINTNISNINILINDMQYQL